MRQRLKASGSPYSPSTALELLRRIQQHRATLGEHSYSGVSKATPEQLSLFAASISGRYWAVVAFVTRSG